jgi:hypothetical protein
MPCPAAILTCQMRSPCWRRQQLCTRMAAKHQVQAAAHDTNMWLHVCSITIWAALARQQTLQQSLGCTTSMVPHSSCLLRGRTGDCLVLSLVVGPHSWGCNS